MAKRSPAAPSPNGKPKRVSRPRPPKRRTIADVPKRKLNPDSLAEKLRKGFSLTDSKRVVALAESWADAKLHKAACQEKRKAILEKFHKAEGQNERKTAALHLVENNESITAASESIKASIHDLTELIMELGDGATIFAAATAPAADGEGEGIEDPAQGVLGGAGGDAE